MTSRGDRYNRAVATVAELESLGLSEAKFSSASIGLGRSPDFLVIGAQKAGTTWLHRNIDLHPNIWASPAKELNYFNELYAPSLTGWEAQGRKVQVQNALNYFENLRELTERQRSDVFALKAVADSEMSDDWYRRIFSYAPIDSVCGESSPDYAVLPRAAIAHVARLQPNIKTILLVRDPIDRLWSHARMAARDGYGEASFDFLRQEGQLAVFLGRSNYPAMIRRWRQCIGARNLLVLSYDKISSDPGGLLEKFCDHIGVPYEDALFPDRMAAVGEGSEMVMPQDVYQFLRSKLRDVYDLFEQIEPEIAAPWVERHYGR